MTPVQLKALIRYVSAVVVVAERHPEGIRELLEARRNLSEAVGFDVYPGSEEPPTPAPRPFADIL